ncbi:hypothetical protein PFTANZ_06077, partial [Plasmodium falciparum Tanzania (2000708)]
MPTFKSSNRYIPYASGKYRGKRYIYIEGDSGTDSGYTDHYSDITSSSESEYEELDINDIYVPHAPKYKTLIEVVLEPSKRDTQNDIPSDNTSTNKLADNEWNTLKDDFISSMLQNTQEDVPQPDVSKELPLNTHPAPSHNNLDQKHFIMSIHDRNLYTGEEYSYNMSNNSVDSSYSGTKDPISDKNGPYSGIDLINDSLSGDYDIYDELLKRKENELFGTNHHPKRTNTYSVAKNTNSDPIMNQLDLFHQWLDRHRDMCEKWNNKEELLDKLKEEWNKDNNSGIPSGDKIPSGTPSDNNKRSDNHVLNTDASIQIDMDNPKTKNEFKNIDTSPNKSSMDTIVDDLEKYNEPYYYDFYEDDIYYDANNDKAYVDHINMDHNKMYNNNSDVPTKVQIEMN